MIPCLSYPFRIAMSGGAETVEQGSERHYAELLAVLVQTRPGDRKLNPGFGIADPTFHKVEKVQLVAACSAFGPPVRIVRIKVVYLNDLEQDVRIEFRIPKTPDEAAAVATTDLADIAEEAIFEEILL